MRTEDDEGDNNYVSGSKRKLLCQHASGAHPFSEPWGQWILVCLLTENYIPNAVPVTLCCLLLIHSSFVAAKKMEEDFGGEGELSECH